MLIWPTVHSLSTYPLVGPLLVVASGDGVKEYNIAYLLLDLFVYARNERPCIGFYITYYSYPYKIPATTNR